ncbi:MAG TPA: ATP-binding cassette domain-containing protein [Candidatus Caenarcaniphilales bacterium]
MKVSPNSPPIHPQICLEQVGLTASSGQVVLLQNISFQVFPGDRIALVGVSGAGKTSLLRLLNRLSEPTEGLIYLDNQEIRQIPAIRLRQQVMLVPQEPKLLGMVVQEALAYPLLLQGVSQTAIKQRLEYWIKQLRIPEDWLRRDEVRLSVGQRQLVAIARALVSQPQVLLLDEPTAALDVGRAEHVVQTITQHRQITFLMATHQLTLARRFCNRVLQIEQGSLIRDNKAEAVDWDELRQTFQQQEQLLANEWN